MEDDAALQEEKLLEERLRVRGNDDGDMELIHAGTLLVLIMFENWQTETLAAVPAKMPMGEDDNLMSVKFEFEMLRVHCVAVTME